MEECHRFDPGGESDRTLRVETEVNVSVSKAMSRTNRRLLAAVIITGISAAAVNAFYIITGSSALFHHLAVAGSVFTAICGMLLLWIEHKKIRKSFFQHDLNKYEFGTSSMTVEIFRAGEYIRTDTVDYSEFTKVKTADGYILLYINEVNAYPVEIKKLTTEQKNNLLGRIAICRKNRTDR